MKLESPKYKFLEYGQKQTDQAQNSEPCLICGQKVQNYRRYFSGCQHDLKICYGCYFSHIDSIIEKGQILTCPSCPAQILLHSQSYIVFFKHLPASKQSIVRQHVERTKSKTFIWLCSNDNCGGRIPDEICEKCGQHYCPKCKQKQHPFQSCLNLKNSSKTESLSEDRTLKCPKCDFVNELKSNQKKKIKKCGNRYCKIIICFQHRAHWNKNHTKYHPIEQTKKFQKSAICQSCRIY